MNDVPEITELFINEMFQANVEPLFRRNVDYTDLERFSFTKKQNKQVEEILNKKFSVLGFDIYKYSKFPQEKQIYIPLVLQKVYEYAVRLLKDNFTFLFQKVEKTYFLNGLISTGDGGFLILETPLHSIIFGLVFETVFRMFNSYRFLPRLRQTVEGVTVRYAITYDNVYRFKNKYFGSAIINNSRLLSKDKLNRLLIDSATYEWFMKSIAGVENLQTTTLKELKGLSNFKDYDDKFFDEQNALIPAEHLQNIGLKNEGIKSVDIQKIGVTKSKDTDLDVYNLHIQAIIEFQKVFQEAMIFTVSLGNLNASGISVSEV
ncbi:MAG: hypothetical protein WC600_00400 [Desulfobaccales bacterium]